MILKARRVGEMIKGVSMDQEKRKYRLVKGSGAARQPFCCTGHSSTCFAEITG